MEEIVRIVKKSKGQIFKEKNGYSKTLKRLLNKHKVDYNEYKILRKERKQKQLAMARDKSSLKRALRNSKTRK